VAVNATVIYRYGWRDVVTGRRLSVHAHIQVPLLVALAVAVAVPWGVPIVPAIAIVAGCSCSYIRLVALQQQQQPPPL